MKHNDYWLTSVTECEISGLCFCQLIYIVSLNPSAKTYLFILSSAFQRFKQASSAKPKILNISYDRYSFKKKNVEEP